MKLLNNIRTPKKVHARKVICYALIMLIIGLITGVTIKWLDLNSEFLGNLFSRIMIWFVLCTSIAVYSKNPLQAALNVFLFCIGMLCTYYLTASVWNAAWSKAFLYGWTAFSLCSPLFAFFVWYAGGKGIFAITLKIGIIAVSIGSELIIFGFRFYNIILFIILCFLLFHRQKSAII